jgi:hypothetical protein
MSLIQLPWSGLYLGNTWVNPSGSPVEDILEWHSGGSTIFISGVGEQEVDIRMDREVYQTWVSGCIKHLIKNKLTFSEVPGIFC